MGISIQDTPTHRVSLDLLGATASLACAVHCAVVALLLGVLPVASVLAAPWIDWVFLAASLCIGLASLVPGYHTHRQPIPFALFLSGIALLVTMRALRLAPSAAEVMLVLVAATCLVSAHWWNRSMMRRCACEARG